MHELLKKLKIIFGIGRQMKKWYSKFFTAVATILELLSIFAIISFDWMTRVQQWLCVLGLLAFPFILALIAVLIQRRCEKDKTIERKINAFSTLRIKRGDIFAQKDYIVIPFNDYFDTLVDDTIINEKTLHGQFIKKYFPETTEPLVEMIKEQLETHGFNKLKSKYKKKNTSTIVESE